MLAIRNCTALALLLICAASVAHHSSAMFDRTRKITVTGVVVKFQYVNPHSWIDVSTQDVSGEQLWSFEAGTPQQMKTTGLTPDVLKAGDKITITGYPLRDGRTGATYIQLVMADGKTYTTKPLDASPPQPIAKNTP